MTRALRRRYGRSTGTCPAGSKVQALLFDRERFTRAQAIGWAKRHQWRTSDVDVTDQFIHLRQLDPAAFRRIRTVYLGGRGVQARVGWAC